jgi:dTDP-4-amino-4,6-dideoxygalactose transaminase
VLREHGQTAKYRHEVEGYTARLDTIQAHVLLRKLPFLDDWNAQRRARAAEYSSLLEGVGDLILPATAPETEHVWHLYVVRSSRVEHLAAFLASRGISTGRHYPSPIHLTPAYESLGYRCGEFPVAEALADEGLSLPLYPGLSEQQLALVVHAIEDFFGGGLRARQ